MLKVTENPLLRPLDAVQGQLRHRTTLCRPSPKRQYLSRLQSRNAIREIAELPALEESLHVVCRGNFPLWSIVPATLKLAAPAVIDRLAIATLGFSVSNAADLLQLFDAGQIRSVALIASIYFARQNGKEFQMMEEGLKARGQRIVSIRSHAKIITLALSDGRRFAVESSANLRSCRNIEQFTLSQSPALHDFHAGWIDEVITAAKEAK